MTIDLKRARIIYNPSSGREAIVSKIPWLLDKLENVGYEASCFATKGKNDAKLAAQNAVEKNHDLVIAAGGDGTIFEVVNGLATFEKRPTFGIIPVGTTNDFARALHVHGNIDQAVDVILAGYKIGVDIGNVNGMYFTNIVGGGYLTELTYEVSSKMKTALGQLAYFIKGIEKLPKFKPVHMRIEYDENVFDEKAMIFLVANTNSVAGFECFSPDATIYDGLFTLLIVKPVNLFEFVNIIRLALKGEHIFNKNVVYAQAKKIKVSSNLDLQLNIDGEFGGYVPAEFVNLQQHLEICVPESLAKLCQKNGRAIAKI